MIPDGIIDACGLGTLGPFDYPSNCLTGLETLVEMKTVANLNEAMSSLTFWLGFALFVK